MAKSFGKISFCKKIINPNFDIKIEKVKKDDGKKKEEVAGGD